MDPITLGLLIGVGGGLLKSELVDRPKEERQRALAAETQRYSPWTGLQANKVQEADPFGSAMQFGTTGAMMGSGIQNMQSQNKLMDNMSKYYGNGGEGSVSNMTASAASADDSPSLGVDYKDQFKVDPSMSQYGSSQKSPWSVTSSYNTSSTYPDMYKKREDGMGYYGMSPWSVRG
jgi:hypothetical protein